MEGYTHSVDGFGRHKLIRVIKIGLIKTINMIMIDEDKVEFLSYMEKYHNGIYSKFKDSSFRLTVDELKQLNEFIQTIKKTPN